MAMVGLADEAGSSPSSGQQHVFVPAAGQSASSAQRLTNRIEALAV